MESTAIDLDVLPTINWFICDFQCNFKQQLADHIKSDHNELISKQAPIQKAQNPAPTRAPAPKPVPVQLYKCPRCERQVRNAAQLTAHTMAKHRKFPHQCLICAKVSRSWKMGKLHIEKAHRNAEINPEDIKTLLKLVPENFKHVVNPTIVETPVQPTNPVPVTAPAPPAQQPTPTPTVAPTPAPIPQAPLVMPMHKCNECGARTRTAEALENHVKTHPPAQPCPKWDFTYKNPILFKKHIKQLHENDFCIQCDPVQPFDKVTELEAHKKIYHPEKIVAAKFICLIWLRSLLSIKHTMDHMRGNHTSTLEKYKETTDKLYLKIDASQLEFVNKEILYFT